MVVFAAARLTLLVLLAAPSAMPIAQSADPAARAKQAAQAMNDGQFDEAAGIYRDLLKLKPDEPGLLMNLGMALAMGGREQEAIAPLQRAAALRPSLMPAHLFLGSSHLALGEPEKAIPPLRRVVRAQPADAESRSLLAQAYLAARQLDGAIAQFRRLTELQPENAAAWYGLGQAYNGLVQEALETFEQDPVDSPWRHLLLADALREDGRYAEAFGLYRSVLEEVPGQRSAHDSVAEIYQKTGHEDWAATERAKANAIRVDCAAHMAACEFRAGRYRTALAATTGKATPEARYWRARAGTELARAAFDRLDTLPDSVERREYRAELARSQGRHLDSVEELKAAVALAGEDPRLLEELATAYHLARDYDNAVATAEPLLDRTQDDPYLLALYGDSLLQLQRLDEAVPILERALKLDPSSGPVQAALGRGYVQKGDFAAAVPLLVPRLEDDEDGSLHLQLARAYQGLGREAEAAPLLEKARALQQAARERTEQAAEPALTPP